MKNLTKKQKLLLLAGLIVFALIYYFGFYNKKRSLPNGTEESGYDSSWINIGDDFFIPNNSNVELVKKYIDGTISNGIKIDSNGNCLCGGQKRIVHGQPNQPGSWIETTRESIPYPKDKGFTKSDSRGNYFYFEPLSDLQMAEINRLTELKRQADQAAADAQAAAAAQEAAAQAAAQQANAAAAQQAAAAKAIAEQKIAVAKAAQAKADAQIAAAKQRSEEIQSENSSKNRMIIMVIIIVLIISVSGYFWYKKHKNS